jgi:polysaccharide biosynthesis PFTS motif protein
MRYIVADRLMMWSPEMAEAFGTAGYQSDRLVEVGPIVFGRQRDFRPTSCYSTGVRGRRTRIGIFDVAILRPESRFAAGYGLLTYNREATERFFTDVFSIAARRFGGDVVIVRKAKRAYHPTFGEDVDFTRLPAVEIEFRDPAESLWRVLEAVDLVVCMPFTSVAYIADECGIPSAYYDPGQDTEPSPLGGRVPVLRTPAALDEWVRAPAVPRPRLAGCVAARVLAAATGMPMSADLSHHSGGALKHVLHS